MKNKIQLKNYRVRPGKKVDLKRWPTAARPVFKSAKHYRKRLGHQVEELSALLPISIRTPHQAIPFLSLKFRMG